MSVRAGQLRHYITIQKPGSGVDSWGQPLDAWVDHASVWAYIRHLSGSESIKADVPTSIVKASIRIRWRTDVDAGMRVAHGATVYEIEAILPGATREYVDLVAKVVT